jgi:hypothetical protein
MAMMTWSFWKLALIGMVLVGATALVTGVVVANWQGRHAPTPPAPEAAAGPPPPPTAPATGAPVAAPAGRGGHPAAATVSAADINACNEYAQTQAKDKTTEVLTDALIGGAFGAGVGAAGGAIAGGGSGAGKGAGIGGVLGATAGTLFGLNEANKHDARSVEAYRACMHRRGYSG